MPVEKKTGIIKSLEKAMNLLKVLTDEPDDLSIPELAYRLDLPKATVHRILVTLENGGFVEQSLISGKYHLGINTLQMANKVLNNLDVRNEARPYLEKLMKETGESTYLAILSRDEIIYIDKVESHRVFALNTQIGTRGPAHATALGKVLLAYLPEKKLDNILSDDKLTRFTTNTIVTLDKLKLELKRIRERGYSLDNEELEEGLQCYAVPVKDYANQVVASISIGAPTSRCTDAFEPFLLERLMAAGLEISRRLGYNEKKVGAISS